MARLRLAAGLQLHVAAGLRLLVVGLRLLRLSAAAPAWLQRRLLLLSAVAEFGLLAAGLRLLLAGLRQ